MPYYSRSQPEQLSIDPATKQPAARQAAAGSPDGGARFAVAAALAAVIIWALVPVGTRFFVQRTDPFVFNAIRFIASGAAALPMAARAWRWPLRDRALLVICSLLAVPGYNVPVALGARSLPAGKIGLLIATEPIFIVAFSVLFRKSRLSVRIIGGSVLALAGVALTSGALTTPLAFPWRGTLEVLAGAASWSCYTVLVGELNERYGTFGVTGAILVLGSAGLLALSLPMIPPGGWPGSSMTFALAAMGLASSLIGFLLWNHACASLPAERVGLFLYLIPLVCVAAGAQLLAEPITAPMLAGGAVTILGVWIAARRGSRGLNLRRASIAGRIRQRS